MQATRTELGVSLALLIVASVLVAFIYLPVLSAPFAFDDLANIVMNPFIRIAAFDASFFDRFRLLEPNPRPVANLSFALNYWAGGGYVVEHFRAFNLVLHIANGLLVYALGLHLLRRLFRLDVQSARFAAVVASLLFVVHPLQTQSVTYVVQRMNELATFFYLLGLASYAWARSRPWLSRSSVLALVACALCLVLGVASKEHAVSLPALLWVYEWLVVRRGDVRFLKQSAVPAFVCAGLGATAAYLLWDPFAEYASKPFTMGQRLLTQLRVLWLYLGLIAWPSPARLSLMHSVETSTSLIAPWTTLAAAFSWVAVLGVAWSSRVARPWLSFAVLWYLLTLSVESSILPLEMVYEHRTYLPLAGLCWVAGAALAVPGRLRVARAGLSFVLIAVLALAAQARNRVWLDGETLWRDTAQKSGHERARVNLGAAILQNDRFDEAQRYLAQITAEFPESSDAHRLLGASLAELGRYDEAIGEFRTAVALEPDDHVSLAGIGSAYAMLGKLDLARDHLLQSIALVADERFVTNLGRVHEQRGELEQALVRYSEAAWIDPAYEPAFRALALLLLELDRPEQAIAPLERAIELDRKPGMQLRLALAWSELGRTESSLAVAQTVARENPASPAALHTYARLLATAPEPWRDLDTALGLAQRSLDLAEGASREMAAATLAQIEAELAARSATRGSH